MITGAASERQVDYESQIMVDSIDEDGTLHLSTSAQVPGADGGAPTLVAVTRTVQAADLKDGREYRYLFSSSGQEYYPGATSLGTSAAVVADLASKGEASIKLDGEVGGLAGLMGECWGTRWVIQPKQRLSHRDGRRETRGAQPRSRSRKQSCAPSSES